jgi:mono/diheme cytochrome c family protein
MKKILFATVLATAVIACTHKAAPTATTTTTTTSTERTSSTMATPTVAADPVATGSRATASATIEAGHTVYTSKCGRCHGLKDPANYTAERWEPILKSMAPKARLSDEETAQVRAYVQANAKKA